MVTIGNADEPAVVSLDDTKTTKRKIATAESLVVRDPAVVMALRLLTATDRQLAPGDRLMSLSSAQFTRCFTAAIKFLGWGDLGVKP